MKQKTAFEYRRISTEEQSNFSISGQGLINQEFAQRNNIKVLKVFTDEGFSAKDFNRPSWKQLEAELTKNRVDYLIVWKYDRLIRNALEALVFVDRLEKKLGITLISVMENYNIDPADPYFFKQRAEMFIDADFERRRISDRTKMGVWSGRSQGRYLRKAPFGYDNQMDSDKKPILVINQEEKVIVEKIYEDFLDDLPFSQILKRAKRFGFKMSGKMVIQRLLLNKAYAGLIDVRAYKSDPAKTVKALHEPIIPESTFWKAYYKLQEQLRPIGPKVLDDNLPLRGFLSCNCGSHHTGAKCKGRSAHYYYYWCNKCRGKNYSAPKVHKDIETILNKLSLSDKVVKALKAQTECELQEGDKERQNRLQQVTREYIVLQQKVSSLEAKYIDNKISDNVYSKWSQEHNRDLFLKEELIRGLKQDVEQLSKQYTPYIEYLSDLNWIYKQAELEYVPTFLKGVFPAGLITLSNGYRTAFLPDVLSFNGASLAPLLQVNKNGEMPFSTFSPLGVANGAQIEPLLIVFRRVINAA